MKFPRVPSLLTNIIRDLRDRHLLLPVAALAVALVVIPMLLKSSPDAPAPAPVVSGSDQASAVSSAVLAEAQVSIRNYRKRLEDSRSKNPFTQQFAAPDSGVGSSSAPADVSGIPVAPAEVAGGDDNVSVPVPVDEAATSVEQAVPVDGDSSTDDRGGDNGGGGGGGKNATESDDTESDDPEPEEVETVGSLSTRRVDLMIGLEGALKLHENIKSMTILPDDMNPVVAFLGTDEAGKRAAFVVAKDATVVAGGACVPVPENCLYLTLKKGQTATLDFGPDGRRFELRLLEVREVELAQPQGAARAVNR